MDAAISSYEKLITRMQSIYEPVGLEDSIPEAGRKLFALHFGSFLTHLQRLDDPAAVQIVVEAGRRATRAATAFPIFDEDKRVQASLSTVRKVVAAAQGVQVYRDILSHPALNDIPQLGDGTDSPLQGVRERVENRATKAEKQLDAMLRSEEFEEAVRRLAKAAKSKAVDTALSISRYEVRHGAPILLHTALAGVRSDDAAASAGDLHGLGKIYEGLLRLDDTIGFFVPLLGTSIADFQKRIHELQNVLHPVYVNQFAQNSLAPSKKMDDDVQAALTEFLGTLHHDAEVAAGTFPEQWVSFNTRTVQRKFSDALLVLR